MHRLSARWPSPLPSAASSRSLVSAAASKDRLKVLAAGAPAASGEVRVVAPRHMARAGQGPSPRRSSRELEQDRLVRGGKGEELGALVGFEGDRRAARVQSDLPPHEEAFALVVCFGVAAHLPVELLDAPLRSRLEVGEIERGLADHTRAVNCLELFSEVGDPVSFARTTGPLSRKVPQTVAAQREPSRLGRDPPRAVRLGPALSGQMAASSSKIALSALISTPDLLAPRRPGSLRRPRSSRGGLPVRSSRGGRRAREK